MNEKLKFCKLLGTNINVITMDETVDYMDQHLDELRGKYVCVSNVHTTVMAFRDADYRKVQNGSAMNLPDGKPLSIVCRMRGHQEAGRVPGPDLMPRIFELSEKKGYRHYFYGSTEKTLYALEQRLREKYPKLNIVGMYSPPFRPLTEEEDEAVVKQINDTKPDFIWIGLGAPKQEKWMAAHAGMLHGVMLGVGAGFDFHAGTVRRAPGWMQELCLEWLFRLMQDPKRLIPRYMDTNFSFIHYVWKENKLLKKKNQILKGGVTGQTTQEFLKPFYKEIENDRFLEKTDRTKHTHKVCRIEKKSGRDGLGKSHLQDMEKMQSVDLNYWLPGDILQKADKMSMAHSLEVRVLFLDKDVWTLAAGLPKEAKIADGTTKDIFRKAVSKYIPQDTDGRKKLGFPIPIRVWLRQDDWYQMVKELFTSKEAEEFFHTEKLLQLLREHKEGKKDNSRKIWTVLAFLIWHHTFFYKESSERQLQSN